MRAVERMKLSLLESVMGASCVDEMAQFITGRRDSVALLTGNTGPAAGAGMHCQREAKLLLSHFFRSRRMQTLSPDTYAAWRSTASVVEQDGHGEKVLLLADGCYLKIFRRKRWLSKTLIWSPAQRFADNAAFLATRSIPCPRVKGVYRMRHPYRSLVHYEPLVGDTLRQILRQASEQEQRQLLGALSAFVASLHQAGVYFRSLHPGNIVRTPEGQFGLIDIADMRCYSKPLSSGLRQRNLRHLLRYPADWTALPADALSNALHDALATPR
jgi:tRNA A-37 threonylcarbamoyl transferase component Bud32